MNLQKPPAPIRDKAHLRFVRSLPCCITGSPYTVVAHHLLRGTGEKCGGRKSGDNWAIPLGNALHTVLHNDGDETGFLERWGIDGPGLAAALYEATGDHERGCRILMERTE